MKLGTLFFGAEIDLEKLTKETEKAQKELINKLSVKLKPTLDIDISSQIKQQLKQPFDVKLQLDKSYLEKIRRQTEAVVNGVNPSGGRKFTASDLRATRANVLVAEHEQKLAALREVTRQKTANANAAEERLNATRAKTALANERLKVTQEQLNRLMADTAKKGTSLQGVFIKLGGAVAIEELARKIVNVTGEFEFMEQAIKTLVGSEQEGVELMGKLREFARISPLEVKDVTKAAQTLLGFNVELAKVPDMIQRLGDVSMGNKERFNALTLAFAQTTSAARLTGEDLRQYVNAGFNPLQYIAERTGKSMRELKDEMSKGAISVEMVEQAFIDATSAGGKFYQMSEKQAQTINGQLAKLSDTLDRTFDSIGRNNKGVITGAISSVSTLVENYEKVIHILEGLVATYGLYRTAVFLATEAEKGYTIAQALSMQATILLEKSQKALNTTILKNPYVLAAVALGGLVTVILATIDSTNEAEAANKRYNEALRKNSEEIDNEKKHIDDLLNTLSDETQAQGKRTEAYNELVSKYPEIFSKYKTEKDLIDNLTEARRNENAEIERKTRLLSKQQFNDSLTRKKELNRLKWLQDNIDINTHGRKPTAEQAEYIRLYRKYEKEIKDAQTWYGSVESAISKLSGVADKEYNLNLGEQRKKQISDFTNAIKNLTPEQAKAQAKRYNDLIRQANASGKKWIGFGSDYVPISIDDAKNVAKQLEEQANKETHTLKEWAEQTAKNTDEARKAAKSVFDDTKQYTKEQAQKIIKSANDTLEASEKESSSFKITDKEGDKHNKQLENERKKAIAEAKQLAEAQEKITGIRSKAQLAAEQAAKDLVFSTREAEITLTEDATERTIKQIELEKDRKLEAISREYEEIRQKRIEEAKKLWDADPNNKGSNFYLSKSYKDAASDSMYSDAQINNRLQRERAVKAEYIRAIRKVNDEETKAMLEYLENYGTTEQKRLAIIKDYENRIANEKNEWRKKSLQKERDRLKAQLENETGEILQFYSSVLSMTADQAEAVGLKIKQNLVDKLQEGEITGEQYLKGIKKIDAQMDRMRKKIGFFEAFRSGGFMGIAELKLEIADDNLTNASNKLKEANDRLSDALERKAKAEESGDEIKIIDAKVEVAEAERSVADAKMEHDTAVVNQQQARKQLKNTNKFSNTVAAFAYLIQVWVQAYNDLKDAAAAYGENLDANLSSEGQYIMGIMQGLNTGISRLQSGDVIGALTGMFFGSISSIAKMHDETLKEDQKNSELIVKSIDNMRESIERALERTLGGIYTTKADDKVLKYFYDYINRVSKYDTIEEKIIKELKKAIGGRSKARNRDTQNAIDTALRTEEIFDIEIAQLYVQRDELIRQLEDEKEKKNKDESAILDYKQSIEEIEDEIKHFAEDMAKSLYDIDIKSWASELGDALFEAWQKGESGAEAFKKKASEIIAELSKNIAVTKLIETSLQPVLNTVVSEMERTKGRLDEHSIEDIARQMELVGETLPDSFNALMDGINEGIKKAGLTDLKELANDSSSATQNGIGKEITEQDTSLWASYLNAMRLDVSVIRATEALHLPQISLAVQQVSILAETQVQHLQHIADNTKRNADAADKIYDAVHRIETGATKLTIK